MKQENYLIHGADVSETDKRTVKEQISVLDKFSALFTFPKEGGKKIKPECILDQNKVGICTAISNVQGVYDRTGKRYSEDFQYGLQKKYFDGAWYEGSSVFNSLRASKKYGYLPKHIFDSYFVRDPNEDYNSYSTRLRGIFDNENLLAKLLTQCEFPLLGYKQITDLSLTSLATAISDVDNIVIARYTCGRSWFYKTISGIMYNCWSGETIEPIEEPVSTPTFPVTGHALTLVLFNKLGLFLANTWSALWCGDGHAIINYYPTEAYKMYFKNWDDQWKLPVKKSEFKHSFLTQLSYTILKKWQYETEMLQYALIFEDCMEWIPPEQRGYFGLKTLSGVRKFQSKYGIPATGFVGKLTLAKLNELYNK